MGMSWIRKVFAKLELNPRLDPNSIAGAIKNCDLSLTAELLKQAYERSKWGPRVVGVYTDGIILANVNEDFVTKATWLIGTAGSITGLYLAFTSKERNRLMSQLAKKEAENNALIQTNSELVRTNTELARTNAELVASNNELIVANNELVKAWQAKVGTTNSSFTWLFGRK